MASQTPMTKEILLLVAMVEVVDTMRHLEDTIPKHHIQQSSQTTVADTMMEAAMNPWVCPLIIPRGCANANIVGQNVEMAPLAQNGQQFGRQQDPNAILNECREIDRGVDAIERQLENLKMLQQRSLDDPDSSQQSATNRQLDALSSETMTMYRNFAARVKALKQQPESGSPKNAPQLGKVDRRLKSAINQYQNVESDFRKKLQTQMARQYRIVRPEASEQEVREAVEDTSNQQVFSQALLQSDRRGQSRQALNAVENRHAAIQKIESQMIELAQLFQDMEALVVQQEEAVTIIEQKGEEVQDNLNKGTEQIGVAIKSARARNRKKWWCLGITSMSFATLPPGISLNSV
jgi:syntaxin 1B/2/3